MGSDAKAGWCFGKESVEAAIAAVGRGELVSDASVCMYAFMYIHMKYVYMYKHTIIHVDHAMQHSHLRIHLRIFVYTNVQKCVPL